MAIGSGRSRVTTSMPARGGLAVGVHTTQFAIREAGLYEPVLRLAAEIADAWTDRPLVRIAGLVGRTEQALAEADIAVWPSAITQGW